MRTITISAALSAGLMAGPAMAADQLNWIGRYNQPPPYDVVVGGKAAITATVPIGVCRAVVNTPGDKYPGAIGFANSQCSVNFGGIGKPYSTYEALVPAQKSASGGTIPTNATNKGAHGARLGVPLYFCRADLGGGKGVQLGSLAPGSSGCLIPYGGTTLTASSYDVLVDLSPRLPLTTANVSNGGDIPVDALVGGKDTDGQTLYYCQASYNGAVVPGKTNANFKSCDIPWGSSEIYVASYQVLRPLWKDTAQAASTFPAYTYTNGVTKIHICHATPPAGPSYLTLPGRYSPSSDSKCNLSNGSAADKPFEILSE
jgi:hypothetical protein